MQRKRNYATRKAESLTNGKNFKIERKVQDMRGRRVTVNGFAVFKQDDDVAVGILLEAFLPNS
eukprot:7313657-Pyramimonas_sp.AAC.1